MSNRVSSSTQSTLLHQLKQTDSRQQDLLGKLSSGKRVQRAADDVTALAKIASLDANVRGLTQANANVTQASNNIQVASGGLTQSLSALQRLRELAVRAADGGASSNDRAAITAQAADLSGSINQIAQSVEVDGQKLLNGSFDNKQVQVGAQSGDTLTIDIASATPEALGVSDIDLSTSDGASAAITAIDTAINQVASQLTSLGSTQTRLDATANVNRQSQTDLTASRSALEDLDIAEALGDLKNIEIRKQQGIAVLSQLNKTNEQKIKILA
ncbi:MAG: hypothetical protein HY696_10110 [Deltaproteobacteria bacterium]|nr:hypothetical protein [Deltaproteobacteria bacterium]